MMILSTAQRTACGIQAARVAQLGQKKILGKLNNTCMHIFYFASLHFIIDI